MSAVELPLVRLDPEEQSLERVHPDAFGVVQGGFGIVGPAIVDEDGVVDAAVGGVLQPLGLVGIEVAVGVVPLRVEALAGEVRHERLELAVVALLLLVEEVAVEPVVLRHVQELLGDDVAVGVGVLLERLRERQPRAEGGVEVDGGD